LTKCDEFIIRIQLTFIYDTNFCNFVAMKKHIPNFLTLLNLFCGCCALISVFNHHYIYAALFLLVSGIADFFDGMSARLFNVNGELGKELDSLADMVSFGLVPGVIVYTLLNIHNVAIQDQSIQIFALPAFIITIFSCLRLARFNLDTRQNENFIGLNVPSNTIFAVGLMLIYHFNTFDLGSLVTNHLFLYVYIICSSFFMVSNIPMFGFKFKNVQLKGNELKLLFLVLSLLSFILIKELAFCTNIILYIILSLIDKNIKNTVI
jgi:CDP-diacylglycerol---serine O-phosphatidyltransferase